MTGAQEPTGSLDVALQHATRLLPVRPDLADAQAREILKVAPGHPVATLILGASQRARGDAVSALALLEPLARDHPGWVAPHYESGLALGAIGRYEEGADALRRAVRIKPDMGDAWRALGDALTALGDAQEADGAYARHIRLSTSDPRLLEPAKALCEGRIAVAESLLREHLKRYPTDVPAIRMLAEVAGRLGRYADAETLLRRCLELAPSFAPALHNLAIVLHRQHREGDALREVERLLAADPSHPGGRSLKAAIVARLGELKLSNEIYAGILSEFPDQPNLWQSYGHSLKTAGRQSDSVAAYRRSIALKPTLGEAYWSLANLKTFRFEPLDIEQMERQLQREELQIEDRFHFHFALGKAYEDDADYARSFEHYAEGNRLRRSMTGYSPDETGQRVRRAKATFTGEFLAARRGHGSPAGDPIFIVGLPRAGSTLVEQILSSHSAVEGTMELPDVEIIARDLGGRVGRSEDSRYPEVLATLAPEELARLGDRYLEQTRVQRRTGAPFFIDKMPNNWLHTGLIHLVLPNAKIIDARRHPVSCCFSAFKQHFARGQRFSYGLEDLGLYYRDYMDLMAHFDRVLPGRVHRVIYERLVDDTESEVRRLLAYCGLPFEDACLRFYENERAVRTASSEQVRRPIYRDALEQWTHFRPWLRSLEDAVGDAVETYAADVAPTQRA
jgi:tetratricopeptide (TPR) repeat protein